MARAGFHQRLFSENLSSLIQRQIKVGFLIPPVGEKTENEMVATMSETFFSKSAILFVLLVFTGY